MTYYNVPQHERQRRTSRKMRSRLERVKDRYIPERRYESERMLGEIKMEVMEEMGIPHWANEGNLTSRTIGTIANEVRERFEKIREEL